jgi:DNA-binding NarL/FixJ family response regulator
MSSSSRRKPATAVKKETAAGTKSPPANAIRIGLADDHSIFRGRLKKQLQGEPDFLVAAEVSSPDEAVDLCQATPPDLLLLDIEMSGATGMSVLERVRPLRLPTKILILTAAISRADLVKALQLGARGAVLKDTPSALLFKSIRRVRAGEFWIGRDMVGDLVQALAAAERSTQARPQVLAPRAFALTARELEIVSGVAAGYTNRQMAQKFGVAEDTIKHHLTSIFDKTGVSSRLELALFAIHHRLA